MRDSDRKEKIKSCEQTLRIPRKSNRITGRESVNEPLGTVNLQTDLKKAKEKLNQNLLKMEQIIRGEKKYKH